MARRAREIFSLKKIFVSRNPFLSAIRQAHGKPGDWRMILSECSESKDQQSLFMNIVQQVKNYVKSECSKPTSKYGYGPYEYHFKPVVKYAGALAGKLGADKEVVIVAAWLHDIGSIINGRSDHHITGAKIAEAKLKEFDYPQERIELVKQCILNHRGSIKNKRSTLEEQIIAEADAMSHFDNIAAIFRVALIFEKKSDPEANEAAITKIKNSWENYILQNQSG
jgi:uncharacterized protein